MMDKVLIDLIKISRAVGEDSSLVQGGGGNTSIKSKDGQCMYIKASGTALKDMTEEQGWRRLNVACVSSILGDQELAQLETNARELEVVRHLQLCIEDDLEVDSRPSVESHLHVLLDKVVIHLHPLAVAAYVCAQNGQAELEKLFRKQELPILWIPYADPGFNLGKQVTRLVDLYSRQHNEKPPIIFLQKHGLIVSGNAPDEAMELVHKVRELCNSKIKKNESVRLLEPDESEINKAIQTIHQAVLETTGEKPVVEYFMDEEIARFMSLKDAKELASLPPVVPEELAYSNGPAVWLDECNGQVIAGLLKSQIDEGQRPSTAFLVKGMGLFVASTKKAVPMIKDIISASFFIRRSAAHFGGVNPLTKQERDFVINWEAENFRIDIAKGVKR
jgi:rhamnose utilization protein RhaD (predicted bifunctional aldolase and dehydrogenase)